MIYYVGRKEEPRNDLTVGVWRPSGVLFRSRGGHRYVPLLIDAFPFPLGPGREGRNVSSPNVCTTALFDPRLCRLYGSLRSPEDRSGLSDEEAA